MGVCNHFDSKYGSIHFHNILGSYSVCQKLSKNEFFGILLNCFVARQKFGPIFFQNDEFENSARANH